MAERRPIETWSEGRPGLWSTPTGRTGNSGTLVYNAQTGAAAFYFTLPTGDPDAAKMAAEDVVIGAKNGPASSLRVVVEADAKLRRLRK